MSEAVINSQSTPEAWELPSRGVVGMVCVILAESAIFLIFVVAYVFYEGKSATGPTPRELLSIPFFTSICLFSSSATAHAAVAALRKGQQKLCSLWLAFTVLLGLIFLAGTAHEWYDLIVNHHFTIQTNLFGTTFYSLVGLHATHVVIGVFMLCIALFFSLRGEMPETYSEKLDVLSLYWHFVDAVWVVVLLVVYVFGR